MVNVSVSAWRTTRWIVVAPPGLPWRVVSILVVPAMATPGVTVTALSPAWMVAVILGRELAVTVLRSLAYARGVTIPASRLGKIKMASQVVAILLLILGRDHVAGLVVVGHAALWVAVGTAVVSATDYYRRYNQILFHGNEDCAAILDLHPQSNQPTHSTLVPHSPQLI